MKLFVIFQLELMLLLVTILVFKIKTIKGKVTFNLPSLSSSASRSSSDSDDMSSTDDYYCDSDSQSSSSSAELLIDQKHSDGRFSHLKKDDDLLALRKKKKNKKNKTKRKRNKKEKNIDGMGKLRNEKWNKIIGGKQSVGFIWENEAFEELKQLDINGYSDEISKLTSGIVKDPLNMGWWLFTFTKSGTLSATKFKFQTKLPVKVSLIDLFCRGDSFGVLDGGKLIAQSSRIRADSECAEMVVSPDEAVKDGRWSSVVFELDAGEHFLELKTIDGPINEGKGVAAIKFDQILPLEHRGRQVSRKNVCSGYNGLVVVTEPVPMSQSDIVCLQLKMRLAQMQEDNNLVVIKRSLKTCLAADGAKAWILEKESNAVRAVGVDGIVADGNKQEKLPVICQV